MINNYRIKTRGKGLTAEQVSSMFKIPFGAEADRGAWEPLQINFMAFVIKVLRFYPSESTFPGLEMEGWKDGRMEGWKDGRTLWFMEELI